MINLTFASFKNGKEASSIKQQISKKHDLPLTSFKSLHDSKDRKNDSSYLKKFDNQENNLNYIQSTAVARKNIVKVEKSIKRSQNRVFKSPLNKNWDTSQSLISAVHPKLAIKTTFQSKCPKGIETSRTQNAASFQTVMTPSLHKNNRSITVQQQFNASFLTQKHSINSDHGSISSNKNSFNDSFQFNAGNLSMEEDFAFKEKGENVNSSMQLLRDNQCNIKDFPGQTELKNMKKSHYFFNTGESVLKDLDLQSNASAASSIPSIKFSQKFKHYKKKNQMRKKQSETSFQISDFELLREIGSGKYGKVYLAKHILTGFICAIKQLSKQLVKDEQLDTPLGRQIKIQLFLNHPNIVQLYGLFNDKDNIYLIMEYCSGNHLLKLIKNNKQLSQPSILVILSNVFQAVSYLHCNGVIHRDIKPENIVIQHGTYKLCDFGWAAYACGDSRTTFCGTPLYVCPQVLKGQQYNEKADIWGLGIVTYQLLFGRVPFSILNQKDLMKIINDPVYFPIWGRASEQLIPYVKKMLSKDPQQRPSLNQILSSDLLVNFRETPNLSIMQETHNIFSF